MNLARRALLHTAAIGCVVPIVARGRAQDRYATARENLLREIENDMHETSPETGYRALSAAVRNAIATVPRERFVPSHLTDAAYENRPLPIGDGQTISQPFIVALMTQLLQPKASDVVLEVGTGSGYQAAVLAECVAKVYSIEIVASLAQRARAALDAAGGRAANVVTRVGDGYLGWPEAAPFDGIMVTAAPDHVPPRLIEQLKPGGRLVIPVGPHRAGQELLVIEAGRDGRAVARRTIAVRFVPLTR
ncbi:MAG TPA: protein-L-isoaspartate(D-aspartate) O-methyltransferase [Burkholderiaceae bacterium]|nr:protein-L-isoaspartate(D-aspartate) O-methyltransferase [Burkholderiaceae bacterium]